MIFLFSHLLGYAHGFGQSTFIRLASSWQAIDMVCRRSIEEKNVSVMSYDLEQKCLTSSKIVTAGTSEVACYIRVGFDPNYNDLSQNDVVCAPYQEFYVPRRGGWVPAHELHLGDELLTFKGTLQPITYGRVITESIPVYMFKVKHTHTFFVGRYGLLTHNIDLVAFDILSCSAALPISMAGGGACFGPIGAVAMGLVTIAASIMINACIKGTIRHYDTRCWALPIDEHPLILATNNDDRNNDSQVPGKPTEKDGYIQPKNWDGKKVKHPKNGRVGWPDNKGQIWVPSGPNGHGGPHWDVQSSIARGRKYRNILPGGKER